MDLENLPPAPPPAAAPPDTTEGAPTLRDRKKLVTRRALRWAALNLVAERGYAHVTVEDIAAAADVSTRTFFNYFPSKDAAIVGEDPELLEQMRAEIVARPATETAFDALRVVALARLERLPDEVGAPFGDTREWLRRLRAIHDDPELRAVHAAQMSTYERVLVQAVAERLGTDPAADPYPALLAAVAVAATRVGVMYWAKRGGLGSPRAFAEAMLDALAAGLPEGPGLAQAITGRAGLGGAGEDRADDAVAEGAADRDAASREHTARGACA